MTKNTSLPAVFLLCFSISMLDISFPDKGLCLAPTSGFPIESIKPQIVSDDLYKNEEFINICRTIHQMRREPLPLIRRAILQTYKAKGKKLPIEIDFNSLIQFEDTVYFLVKTSDDDHDIFIAVYNPETPPDMKHLKVLAKNSESGVAVILSDSVEPFLLANYRFLSIQEKPFRQWLKKFDLSKSELEFFVKMDEVKENPILSHQSRKQLQGIPTKSEKKTFKTFAWLYALCVGLLIVVKTNLSSDWSRIAFNNGLIIFPVLAFLWIKYIHKNDVKKNNQDKKKVSSWLFSRAFWQAKIISFSKIFSVSILALILTRISTVFHEFGHWVIAGISPWVTERHMVIEWRNFILGIGSLAYVGTHLDTSALDPSNPIHRYLFITMFAVGSFFEWGMGMLMIYSGYKFRNKWPLFSSVITGLSIAILLEAIQYPLHTIAALSNLQIPGAGNDWFNFIRFAETHVWNIITFFFATPILFLGYLTYEKSLNVRLRLRLTRIYERIKKLFQREIIVNLLNKIFRRTPSLTAPLLDEMFFNKIQKETAYLRILQESIHRSASFHYLALGLHALPKNVQKDSLKSIVKALSKTDANLFILRLMAFNHFLRLESQPLVNYIHTSDDALTDASGLLLKAYPEEVSLVASYLNSFTAGFHHTKDKTYIKTEKILAHLQKLLSSQHLNALQIPAKMSALSAEEMSSKINALLPDRLSVEFVHDSTFYFAFQPKPESGGSENVYYTYHPESGLKSLRTEAEIASFHEKSKEYFLKATHFNAGGTIDMKGETARRGLDAVKELISQSQNLVASSVNIFPYSVDSSTITPEEHRILILAVNAEIERKKRIAKFLNENPRMAGGIVINHGTDTAAETSLILSTVFNGKTPFPIVLTGGLLPPDQPDSDARGNLKKAVELAMVNMMPPLVYGVFMDQVFLGDQMYKSALFVPEDQSSNYFDTYGLHVGNFIAGELVLTDDFIQWWTNHRKDYQKMSRNKFGNKRGSSHPEDTRFAYVEHVVITPYTSPDVIIDAIKRAQNRIGFHGIQKTGIVIEGSIQNNHFKNELIKLFHDESLHPSTKDSLIFLTEDVQLNRNVLKIPAGLPAWQARTLLSLMLGTHLNDRLPIQKTRKALLRFFNLITRTRTSTRSAIDPLLKEIKEDFSQKAELVKAFPGMDANGLLDAIHRADRQSKKLLFVECFGDGHLPIGIEPAGLRLKKYLKNSIIGRNPAEVLIIEKIITKISDDSSLSDIISEMNRYFTNLNANQRQAFQGAHEPATPLSIVYQAMLSSHPILAALDEAKKKGINVIALSNVEHGRPDLTLYEIGHFLKLMNVVDLRSMNGTMDGRFPLLDAHNWKNFSTQSKKPRLIILGPPGSGKQTQGKMLARHFGVPYISSGELIRSTSKEASDIGAKLRKLIKSGKPIADAFVASLIYERLLQPDAKDGFILDGVPQSIEQANMLEKILHQLDAPLDTVIQLNAPDDIMVSRIFKERKIDKDDADANMRIKGLLQQYRKASAPVISYYYDRNMLKEASGALDLLDHDSNKDMVHKSLLLLIKQILFPSSSLDNQNTSNPDLKSFEMAA